MMVKFNINNHVKVKLTLRGYDIHRFYWTPYCTRGTYTPPKADEDGYSVFQLHDLMQVFGQYVGVGNELPFEIEIYLDTGL